MPNARHCGLRLSEVKHVLRSGHLFLSRVLVSTGHPARRIVELADDYDADLLVIATHGRTGLQRVLLGSVAEHVTGGCPVPFLR